MTAEGSGPTPGSDPDGGGLSRSRGRRRPVIPPILATVGAGLFLLAAEPPTSPDQGPREIGLTERATGRLAQLDVTVRGRRPAIAELTRDDFELVVGGKFVEEFLVDRVCELPLVKAQSLDPEPTGAVESAAQTTDRPRPAATTFLFYFDQHHLNGTGRQRSLDLSRKMIPDLIAEGNQAMIVSAGQELATFSNLTDDVAALLEAVDRVEQDHKQWDFFPFEEHLRLNEVLRALSEEGRARACQLARKHQNDEIFQTERALRRFIHVLGRFAGLDPPKAVIYFADTMRSRPGEHYAAIFGQSPSCDLTTGPFVAASTFDRVVREAAAYGVRIYSVQAEGLVTDSILIRGGPPTAWTSGIRVSDAQASLAGLALETGGQAFLNGVSAKRMARQISADLDCVYLLSFHPAGFPLDKPLPVLVRVKRPGVKVHARGTFLLQSESARVASRLLAAFLNPEESKADRPLSNAIVPTGYRDGRFHALVQVALRGSPLPRAEWDLGFSLVQRDEVREDDSRRIAIDRPGVLVVLEKELTFERGPFELVAVARETRSDQVATASHEAVWPDPMKDDRAGIGPVAVLQPREGVFLRDAEIRSSGVLALGETEALCVDSPTVIVGIVCRRRPNKATLRLHRRLVGDLSAEFPPTDLEPSDESCVQFQDRIPEGAISPGAFVYEIRLLDGDEEIAMARRAFVADDVSCGRGNPGGNG